jgi:hypothetical protein
MKRSMRLFAGTIPLAVMTVLAGWLVVRPMPLAAQGTQGQNTVYSSTTNKVGSSAFIDARQFLGVTNEGRDLCDTIFYIFANNYPSNGVVIDARGISGSALTCTHGTPWTEGSTTYNLPSTILLPPGTIQISATWYVPSNTKLIGEGENNSPSAGTTIQAASGFSGAMINLGPQGGCPAGGPAYRVLCEGRGCSAVTAKMQESVLI